MYFITLGYVFIACLFQSESRAIVVTRLLLLSSSCKNFNIPHYSKSVKGRNTKLGIFVHHVKMYLQDKGHNSESYISAVTPLLIKTIK